MANSTVSGNRSTGGYGGGIYTKSGSVNAIGSTISGNNAYFSGGGIYAHGNATLTNATVSNNFAGGNGGGLYASSVTLNFCTLAGNGVARGQIGGGIAITFDATASTASASLFYGNAPGNDVDATFSVALGGDHNLIGTQGSNILLTNTALTCDPHLGPLFANGGSTKTHPLFAGSCARNAGPTTPGAVATDQRGLARKVGSATDIGAFEKQGPLDPPDLIFVDGFDP